MEFSSASSPSTVRFYPSSPVRSSACPTIDAALNERFSCQVAMRCEGNAPRPVAVAASGPDGWAIRVRRVGYVPVLHYNLPAEPDDADLAGRGKIPGYVPDPLFDESSFDLPPGETHAFWVSVCPGKDAAPGNYAIEVAVTVGEEPAATHSVPVTLHDVRMAERQEFSIKHWFYVDALIDWYKTDLFDERFWEILAKYHRNTAEHGLDTTYLPVFTPPLDGVKRPSQLLRVSQLQPGNYEFDWTDVERYVRSARACGIRNFEWCHPFTQWGVKHAIRIYEGQGREEKLLWQVDTGATSDTYRNFLLQYLPQLRAFLDEHDLTDHSFFHVSDEPHGEEHLDNYRKARAFLAELAPWMKVMDALTDIEYGRQGLTDMPIPSIRTALDFVNEGIPCWCYYCCGPRSRFLNRLMDTPLAKIAMHGLLFYRWPFKGFLHWGYNYWYESQTRNLIDPFTVQDGSRWPGWAYGDTFQVYPGPEGPIDSIRWEVFGESLQDYRLLQTLGVDRDHQLLAPIRSFEDFPKADTWRRETRARLFAEFA